MTGRSRTGEDPGVADVEVPPGGRIGASVAIGSTSVHFTAAVLWRGSMRILADESALLGLGRVVEARGGIEGEARQSLVETLVRFRQTAAGLGAADLTIVATEPLRRAGNHVALREEILAATGSPVHVLSHEEEAWLALYGVLRGRRPPVETMVVDIGGGSTEYVVARRDGPPAAFGLRVGAAGLTHAVVRHDPPTGEEIAALREEAGRRIAAAEPLQPRRAILVGGTATNLLRIAPSAGVRGVIDARVLREAFAVLQRETAASLAERCLVRVERARILAGGAAIVEAMLARYGLRAGRVSEASVREGAILAAARAGAAWRDHLPALVGAR